MGMDNLSFARRPTLVAALSSAVEETPAQPKVIAPPTEQKVEAQAQEAIDAKTSLGSQKAPAMGIANEALKSAKDADPVKLTADSLKLTAETVAKATPAANGLNAGGNIIDGLNKAAQGDAFGAASAASAAAEKIAPTLAKSGVGAIASAVILGTGDTKLGDQAKALGKSAQRVIAPNATPVQRTKAAMDLTVNLQNTAGLARTLALAAANVGRYGVRLAGKVPAFAPAADGVKAAAVTFTKTPFGRAMGVLNKWIPLLNVAGVAISAKTAVDVFRTAGASKTTKALSIASLATAGVALWAGFALPGMAFLGIIGGSIAMDLMLAGARKRDAAEGDMDAKTKHWATHPAVAARDLGQVIGEAIPAIGRKAVALGKQARDRVFGGDQPATPASRRALT